MGSVCRTWIPCPRSAAPRSRTTGRSAGASPRATSRRSRWPTSGGRARSTAWPSAPSARGRTPRTSPSRPSSRPGPAGPATAPTRVRCPAWLVGRLPGTRSPTPGPAATGSAGRPRQRWRSAQAGPGAGRPPASTRAVADRVLRARRAGPPRPAAARDHRARVLRGPHARPDRRPHRDPARHGQIPHPAHARTPTDQVGGGRCSTARLSSWPSPRSASPCPPTTPRTSSPARRCRAEVASLQRSVDAVAVPQLAAPGPSVPPPPARLGGDRRRDRRRPPPRDPTLLPHRPTPAPLAEDARGPAVPVPAPPAAARRRRGRGRRGGRRRRRRASCNDADGGEAVDRPSRWTRWTTTTRPVRPRWSCATTAPACWRSSSTRPALDDGYYEVWLIEPRRRRTWCRWASPSRAPRRSSCPPTSTSSEFPVVDVSVEPLDGDPTHSGVSVARGELES